MLDDKIEEKTKDQKLPLSLSVAVASEDFHLIFQQDHLWGKHS
jgi:hypothetical protein